jgi:hypothetical protein
MKIGMPKNNLYAVINHVFIKKRLPLEFATLTPKMHKSGVPFVILDLPVSETSCAGYNLLNHHVTVFDESTSTIDARSQYHYTAILKDEADIHYRLHVYFSKKNKLIGPPYLSRITADAYEPVSCSKNFGNFVELATRNSQTLINVLRSKQNQLISKLEKKYAQLERKIVNLSKNLEKNKKLYVETLEKQLVVLDEIKLYENNQKKIATLIANTKKRKASVENMERTPEVKMQEEQPQSPQSPVDYSMVILDREPAKKKLEISAKIVVLEEEFERIKLLNEDEFLAGLSAIFRQVVEKELEVESGVYSVTEQDLSNLKALRDKLEQSAKKVMETIYKEKQYSKISKLSAFFHLIPQNFIADVLTTDDVGLLDFLLKHKIITVEAGPFSVAGNEYTSILDYYLNNASNLSVIACLNAFIKHGLNILEVDKASGLPFAALLLLSPSHPLADVLQSNNDLILDNPNFYRQVNQKLKEILNQSGLTCSKAKIKALIEKNNKKIREINLSNEIDNIDKELTRTAFNTTAKGVSNRIQLLDRKSMLCKEMISNLDFKCIGFQTQTMPDKNLHKKEMKEAIERLTKMSSVHPNRENKERKKSPRTSKQSTPASKSTRTNSVERVRVDLQHNLFSPAPIEVDFTKPRSDDPSSQSGSPRAG